ATAPRTATVKAPACERSRGDALRGRERPLLEGLASAVRCEPNQPQVTELGVRRPAVRDFHPYHRSLILDRDDVGTHREDLVRSGAFLVPHPPDRGETDHWFLVRALAVDGVVGEEVGERGHADRSPRLLVAGHPASNLMPVHVASVPDGKQPATGKR